MYTGKYKRYELNKKICYLVQLTDVKLKFSTGCTSGQELAATDTTKSKKAKRYIVLYVDLTLKLSFIRLIQLGSEVLLLYSSRSRFV